MTWAWIPYVGEMIIVGVAMIPIYLFMAVMAAYAFAALVFVYTWPLWLIGWAVCAFLGMRRDVRKRRGKL